MTLLNENRRGAVLIELTLTIGFFIGIVYMLFFFFMAMNARTSLTISLGEALRHGVTRGDKTSFSNNEVLVDVGTFKSSGNVTARLSKYLYSRGSDDTESVDPGALTGAQLSHVKNSVTPHFSIAALSDLPSQYLYSLIYAHEYMRVRVGVANVKYPCDDRPGCLLCEFKNPDAPIQRGLNPTDNFAGQIPGNRIFLECSYFADLGLLSPAYKLLGIGDQSGTFKITRSAFVNRVSS